ncbi:TonB-dependent receptor [Lewinellaceae bacterium SD302]|nr:TonB-dependent receptor [Lewinellaceae bacterium SD302]
MLVLVNCLLQPPLLEAQDSLLLDQVTVSAFRDELPTQRIAGSVAVLEKATINEYPDADLLASMNRIAGVRFEQRAPGSYRVSVRGSTLRSPFGVRNLKVYWNGFPLTEPGGDTQLNFLDVANVDRIELIKGPAGSLYGAGNAGTLLLKTDSLEQKAELEVAGGSFGYFRTATRVKLGKEELRYAAQGTNGYRDHSGLFRQTVQYSSRLGRATDLHLLYTDLSYDLPGGLNEEQYLEDPTQARPGSADKNASINYHNLLLGLGRENNWGKLSNQSRAYATGFYFDHPFNFDYKRETNLGVGGHSVFDYQTSAGPNGYLKISAGGEYQLQYRMANNFTNPDASPGELNFSDEIDSRQWLLFGQSILALAGGWRITAGLSLNKLSYQVDRTFDAAGDPALISSDFAATMSPRISVLKELGNISLYASLAEGFSPPTLDEFRTNEGSINTNLAAERGTNYEFGLKGQAQKLTYELSAYRFRLNESISAFSDDRGTQLFRNAGETDQWGIEISGEWSAMDWLNFYASYTYQNFTYLDYEREGEDVSGQRLPGTAPHVVNLIVDYRSESRFSASLNYNYTDAIPLNDANTVFGESYHLVRLRLAYRVGLFTIHASGSNLLDERMSFGNDLNPRFGGRYFQPAAGINGSVGIKWSLL